MERSSDEKGKVATGATQDARPRCSRAPTPSPPVRVAADGSVVVLEVGAEGGSLTLVGRPAATGEWQFARVVDDQTEALFGESGIAVSPPPALQSIDWVEGWEAALRLLDRYPWARLHPLEVHPEFAERVWVAVEERLASESQDSSTEYARGKWERVFGQNDR
jgi:hypothetical protein